MQKHEAGQPMDLANMREQGVRTVIAYLQAGGSPDHLHSLDAAHPRMSPDLGLGAFQPKMRNPLR